MIKRNYQEHRDKLLPIIESVGDKNNIDCSQQIDQALLDSRAFLFSSHSGFVVLQPTVKQGDLWVNIMFAYSEGTTALAQHMNEICWLAQIINATGVELYTVVKKLDRFLIRKGFTKDSGPNINQHWIKIL
jgi:hypothetical protein